MAWLECGTKLEGEEVRVMIVTLKSGFLSREVRM